jgi:chorismate mutase
VDKKREEAVIRQRKAWAEETDLAGEMVTRLFLHLMQAGKEDQRKE